MAWDSELRVLRRQGSAGLRQLMTQQMERDHRVTGRAIWNPHFSKTWALPTNWRTCCLPWDDQKSYIISSPSITVCPRENINFIYVYVNLCCVLLFATPWTITHHASLSMEFSEQEYWSGLPSPQGIFPNPGFLHCRQILYRLSHQGSQKNQSIVLTNHSNQLALKHLTDP